MSDWDARETDGAVWVTRSVGRVAKAAFRVQLVDGRAVVMEARVSSSDEASQDGLSSTLLREAVTIRGVVDAAEPLLGLDANGPWPMQLRDVRDALHADRDGDIALAAIGYAIAVDLGSRRAVAEVAAALGRTRRRVKGDIERARAGGLLGPAGGEHPDGRTRRGLPGGSLMPYGNEALATLLRLRLGLETDAAVLVRINPGPGSAAALLRFLGEPPAGDPTRDLVALRVEPSGVMEVPVDEWVDEVRVASDGTRIMVIRR